MTRPRGSDTRQRIQAAAVELFMAQGIEKTSLREIAEQLGITKAALYYHFPSKDALVRSLIDAFVHDLEAELAAYEARDTVPPREFLESHFDLFARHRRVLALLLRDVSAFAHLGLEEKLVGWQLRLRHLLVGPDADPVAQVRAVLVLGGIQDVAALLPEIPADVARQAAVEAGLAALGHATD